MIKKWKTTSRKHYLGGFGLENVRIRLKGAAHQRAAIKCLQHDGNQIPGRLQLRRTMRGSNYQN